MEEAWAGQVSQNIISDVFPRTTVGPRSVIPHCGIIQPELIGERHGVTGLPIHHTADHNRSTASYEQWFEPGSMAATGSLVFFREPGWFP